MNDPREALVYALETYPQEVEATTVDELVMDSARQNAKRPAYLKLAVPDELVKALRGSADRQQDMVLLVKIPKKVVERSESSIILPNEV